MCAPCAWAQRSAVFLDPQTPSAEDAALLRAAFASSSSPPREPASAYALAPVALRADADDAAALDGPFILPAYTGDSLGPGRLSAAGGVISGGAVALWSHDEVLLGASPAGVDSVRMSLGAIARAPGGVISGRPDGLFDPAAQSFDVRYIHGWPSALKWSAAGYDLDVSPHAGLGMSSAGGTAEAGAMIRFGSGLGKQFARKLGLHEVDGSTYGDQGRWYLFAAASGQAVGLNMTPGAPGMPRNSWSSESTSALISDAQAGLGWRKGAMQASFGYVHREIRGETVEVPTGSPNKISDSMVAFSLSIHPR
jgi:hypothetical protein